MRVTKWLLAVALALPLPTSLPTVQLPALTPTPAVSVPPVPSPPALPAPVPSVALPAPVPSASLPAPVPSAAVPSAAVPSAPAPAGATPAVPTSLPSGVPAVVPQQPGATPPGQARSGRPGGAAPSQPGPAESPAAAVSGRLWPDPGSIVAVAADTPLGPVPPIVGIVLLAISIGLFIHRRLDEEERRRALEFAKTEFLKVASHELRTPLTVIRGYVAMATEGALGPLPAKLEPVLPALESKLSELDHLVDQLLEAARLDERALRLRPAAADLGALAAATVSAAEPAAGSRHRLVLERPSEPVPVRVDPTRFGLVLKNLVDNAIKFSPAGGEVRVSVARRGRRAEVSVEDHGIGIAREHLAGIFQRFGRIVTPANSAIPGSGLGLFLARELIRMHRGEIRVSSEVARGSVFVVSLPLAEPFWRGLRRRRARPGSTAQTRAPVPRTTLDPSSE